MRRVLLGAALMVVAEAALAQAPAPARTLKPPVPGATVELFRRQGADGPSLEAAFVRDGGVLAVLIQEGSAADAASPLRQIEIAADGHVLATRRLAFDLRGYHRGTDFWPLSMRDDGTVAYLERRDGATRLVEIMPDGRMDATTVAEPGVGHLIATGADGHLAYFHSGENAARANPEKALAWLRRDGTVAWRAPAPPRQQISSFAAVPAPGGFLLFWNELEIREKGPPLHHIAVARAAPAGLAPPALTAGFAAEGAGIVVTALTHFPSPAAGGFFVTGWLFGGEGRFCAWLDGGGRLRRHNGAGAGGTPSLDCPWGPALGLADGGLLAAFGNVADTTKPGPLARLDANARVLWRLAPARDDGPARFIVAAGPDALWLVGESRQSDGTVERLWARRLAWPTR